MRAALAPLPGVRDVQVDFDQQQATVTVEKSAYDEQALIEALEEAGFGGSVMAVKPARALPVEDGKPTARPNHGTEPTDH